MKIYVNPTKVELKKICSRPFVQAENLDALVENVFEEVASKGDEAVKEFSLQFDKFAPERLKVSAEEIVAASSNLSTELKLAIRQAYDNIYLFHSKQNEVEEAVETMTGVRCWRKSVAIRKVGLYIPGGSAPLFSTILMLGIPAKIAGCKDISLCTPSNSLGEIHPAILFTAQLVGIKNVFKIGGIQAIAAMTFGTESVPYVYKIFGPGNQYVTAAKVYAQKFKIAIDMPAGPSEVMVVCDEFANPAYVASDLLAQAEHGSDSQVLLLTTSENIALAVQDAVALQLKKLPRIKQASAAISGSSIVVCKKEELIGIVNDYAPEHLILNTQFNSFLVENIVNAGSVFIGEFTPESAGDYASGTNHTLPTNGFAKQYSGVSVDSFVKKITYQKITKEGLKTIGNTIELMAEAEGLFAHKNAISIRLNDLK